MVVILYNLENVHSHSESIAGYLDDKYKQFVQPESRREIFNTVLHNLTATITNWFPAAQISPYGSFAAGVAVSRSDLDICVSIPGVNERDTARRLSSILKNAGYKRLRVAPVKDMYCVFGADTSLQVKFDMTLNQPDGSIVTSIVRSAANNPTAKRLIVLIKEIAKCQDINSPASGTLSSISYCFLCIYYLIRCKILPKVPLRNEVDEITALLEEYETLTLNFNPTVHPLLSDLLYSFFRFYSQDFDFTVYAVSLSHVGFVKKADLGFPHTDHNGKPLSKNQLVIVNPYGPEEWQGQAIISSSL